MTERPSAIIIGNGGREHAFATALGPETEIFVSPGNAGTEQMPNVTNVSWSDVEAVDFATEQSIDMAIIGPEAPLVRGLADEFRAAGIDVVGPNKGAAQLESSKSFATEFMERQGIPYPVSWVIHSLDEFLALETHAHDIVIKADGLAGGKGVVLPETNAEARTTVQRMFSGAYDNAGTETIVIQERLSGPEVSAFVLTDGTNLTILPFAQDHKRLQDGDYGPNTGGMGAYAPVPDSIVSEDQKEKIAAIAQKTIDGMREEGNEYKGILYIGVMLAKERDGDPVVIEYNVRFGDPEAQSLLTLMQHSSTDTFGLFRSTNNELQPGLLDLSTISRMSALTITLAASGYPNEPKKGDTIFGLNNEFSPNVTIHHGGTKVEEKKHLFKDEMQKSVVTNGGRVLYITGVGQTIDEAAAEAYQASGKIHFRDVQRRMDIGAQARTPEV